VSFFSGFFNSYNSDRTYDAVDFSRYLDGIITNGCFPNDTGLLVIANDPGVNVPSVKINPGKAYLNGMWFMNDATYTYTMTSQITPNQIHLIYLCFDTNEAAREVRIEHQTGSNPTLPANGAGKYYLPLARVADKQSIQPGAADITDTRMYAGVSGTGIDTPSLVDGAVTNEKVAPGTLTWDRTAPNFIPSDTINKSMMLDNAVGFQELETHAFRPNSTSYDWVLATGNCGVTNNDVLYSWTADSPKLTGLQPSRHAFLIVTGYLTVSHSAHTDYTPTIGLGLWNTTSPTQYGVATTYPGYIRALGAQTRGRDSMSHAMLFPISFGMNLAPSAQVNLRIAFTSSVSGSIYLQASRSQLTSFILPR
jgi:hypothetical protein